MSPFEQRIADLATDVPAEKREAYVAGILEQAEGFAAALIAEEQARAAHTMRALEQVERGETMSLDDAEAHMERFLTKLRQRHA